MDDKEKALRRPNAFTRYHAMIDEAAGVQPPRPPKEPKMPKEVKKPARRKRLWE